MTLKVFYFTERAHIEGLVLTERIETVVPIIFLIIFSMTYFGPNAEHLGNIKLTIWHYIGIENINHALQNLAIYLCVDISSFLVNGIFLWFTCGINVLKVLTKLQKKMWFFMALMECSLFLEVNMQMGMGIAALLYCITLS